MNWADLGFPVAINRVKIGQTSDDRDFAEDDVDIP